MSPAQSPRETFVFAPPHERTDAWHLRLDDFAERLRQEFPGARVEREESGGLRDRPCLTFEVDVTAALDVTGPLDVTAAPDAREPDAAGGNSGAEGGRSRLEGLVDSTFDGTGSVLVRDASPQETAPFAAWLRDRYVPEPDLVRFTSQLALAKGHSEVRALPATGGAEDIALALQQHLNEVTAS